MIYCLRLEEMVMKQNHRIMWIHILIIVLSIIFFVGVGIGSFVLIQNVFKTDENTMETSTDKQKIIADVSVDRIAVSLIYEVDDNKIIRAAVEIFNSDVGNIDYITIPGNMELTISKKITKKLIRCGIDVNAKSIRLDELIKYFGNDSYQLGQMILGDVLGINISYYTVFNKKNFVKYFVEDDSVYYYGKNKYEFEILVFSETFKTKLKQFDFKLDELIYSSYNEMSTNFNLNNRLKYLEKYDKVDVEKIYFWHVMGKKQYGRFIINKEKNETFMKRILSRKEQYAITQSEYNAICKGNIK